MPEDAAPPSKEKTAKGLKAAFQSVKGMHDILPPDQPYWERIRKAVRDLTESYNFIRIDTPLVERAELFERTSGESSQVVEKQMYVFKDKDGNRLALRPEGTAPVARAYLEHGFSHFTQPVRLYYLGPMFRYEQPQAGRFRQHHQVGFEIIGDDSDPVHDAQIILVAYRLLEDLKIPQLNIQLNTIGCRNCRPLYRRRLQEYYKNQSPCRDCRRRITLNPLRVLDCKHEQCQPIKAGAPAMIDSLCVACSNHFKALLEYLDELELPYTLNNTVVRGLDYYTRMVFEIISGKGEVSLGGGGRYDYLIETLGGRSTGGTGFAVGIERLILILREEKIVVAGKERPKIFFIQIGALAKKKSLVLMEGLRRAHIDVLESLGKDSFRLQLKVADKECARLALIFGQKEAFEESIIIRDLESGNQETVPLTKMVEEVKKRL